MVRFNDSDRVVPVSGFELDSGQANRALFARSWAWLASLVLFMLVCTGAPSLHAQVQNGTISGTVTDPNGAVVPEANVTLVQRATSLSLHSQTNSSGVYSFLQLQPGPYTVTVEKQGFQKAAARLTLTVGQSVPVDVVLSVGSNTETIAIHAEDAATLDTTTSNLDYTVDDKQVDSLPLNGRNPYGLAALAPGIAAGANFGVGTVVARGAVVAAATNNFEANGGLGGNNEVLLDGVSIAVCCQGQPAVTPSTEVVNQFKVVTSNPPAQYGRTSGAILNIASKSGDNTLRGDVYDFLRNDKLDAANFFTKRSGVYPYRGHNDFRPPHRANQFGAIIGGPVYIPHAYNGKDKTFFFFGYEGVRNNAPVTGLTTVPTELMRQGIFTEATTPIYDPNSSDPVTGIRTPIPAATCNGTAYGAGQCIPTIDPVAQRIMTIIPEPNVPGLTNNYAYAEGITDVQNQYNFRVDHNFSDRHRTFVRGTRDSNLHTNYDLFNDPNGINGGWVQPLTAYLFAIGHVWTVSPTTLVQFSYGWARQANYQLSNNFFKHDATEFGFSSSFASEQQQVGVPTISWSSLASEGFASYYNWWAHNAHTLNASVLLQRGTHSIAIGYNGRLNLENQKSVSNALGSLGYSTNFTNVSSNAAVPTAQNAFLAWAAFLMGYPSSASITRNELPAFDQWVTSLYVQDDWRVTPKLTINAGVRWDVETGFHERYNKWADFSPTIVNPYSSQVGFNILGGAQFMGVNGNPSRAWPTYYHEVGPRLGFSYALTDKTVLRGGYGILYLPTSQRGYSDPNIGYAVGTNMPTSATGWTPVATSSNPLPDGVALPVGSAAGPGVSVGSTVSGFRYDNPVSYQQQWSFGVEREVMRGISLTLNYAGGHGVHLPMNIRPDDLQPQYYGQVGDPGNAQTNYLQQQVSNPFYGIPGVGSGLTNKTVQRAQLLAMYPQYAGGTISGIQNGSVGISYYDIGSATYNAFQAVVRVHRENGLDGSLSYVYSKLLGNVSDLTNGFLAETGNPGIQSTYFLNMEHSILATDTPHRITGTASYPLPFGKGRRFGNTMPTWLNEFAGGWTVTIIADVYSGFPLSMGVTGTGAFAGTRPMWVDGVQPLTSGSTHNRLGGTAYGQTQGYLNSAAFARPQAFQLGNVPRSSGLIRGPLSFDDNVSLIKNFPIHEGMSLEVRAEAFNILNKVQFGLPNVTVDGSTFGQITAQQNNPRQIQMGGRLHF